MKRTIVLVIVVAALLVGITGAATAEVRLDFDIPWLLMVGLNTSDITGSTSNSVDLSSYHFPLPYVELAYQFGAEDAFLRGGVGIRTYTLLVQFAGWPMGYIEVEPLQRLVLRAELGGFAFFLFGAYNQLYLDSYTLKVLLPDFQASFEVAPWFRIGAGVLLIAPLGDFNNFGYVTYINARFALTWK